MDDDGAYCLGIFNKIDVLDHFLKITNVHYIRYKRWHTGDLCNNKIVTDTSCSFYLECAEGNLGSY